MVEGQVSRAGMLVAGGSGPWDFCDALCLVKEGYRVARSGWNGKGMFIFLVPGSRFVVSADRPMGKAAPELVGQEIDYAAHIDMRAANGVVVPWLASQTDLLATDWELVSPYGSADPVLQPALPGVPA